MEQKIDITKGKTIALAALLALVGYVFLHELGHSPWVVSVAAVCLMVVNVILILKKGVLKTAIGIIKK